MLNRKGRKYTETLSMTILNLNNKSPLPHVVRNLLCFVLCRRRLCYLFVIWTIYTYRCTVEIFLFRFNYWQYILLLLRYILVDSLPMVGHQCIHVKYTILWFYLLYTKFIYLTKVNGFDIIRSLSTIFCRYVWYFCSYKPSTFLRWIGWLNRKHWTNV